MENADSIFLGAEDFAIDLTGERMCPRCMCCSVGVGSYDPPTEWLTGRIRFMRPIPLGSSLLREPTGTGEEAWFCRGGCNEKGEHPDEGGRRKTPTFPSLIARVRQPEDGPRT